ncbi:putative ABC transport system substrate-binding protein [Orenia metallireducens]|uniref:Putative ABC transport system substrate-binding protein n=1 Tax=Orenia metallireducens TaxID=1413210 RepID=A0A285HQZ4_9FIRM|nr:ABC transporter substrate-binding protein [Orenia metallireducens]PRX25092.1 putative ABC transport system substrate-binding protein [Orenia metallireducens]SNY38095.1 putative ABC transport system substrate-binding protein [Orenia metallireducens]
MRSRVVSLLVVILSLGLLIGCSNQGTDKAAEVDKPIKVGIIQIVEHPALDAAREGFIEELATAGYKEGENITYDYKNAQGDMATAQTIAKQFAYDELDLILAIATPTAQAVANSVKETPILITAVTDPKSAGLVESLEEPGANITGTSDLTPVKKQLELLTEIVSDVKKVGIIYNGGEINSVVQAELAEKAAKELGLELVPVTVSSSNEVYQGAQSLVGRVKAIYVPTDNTVVSAIQSVVKVANENDLPLVVGEDNSVENGGLATVGINYYQLGRQTAKMAVKVLAGEDPATMPIQYLENTDLVINLKAAKEMNIELSREIIDRAKKVIE